MKLDKTETDLLILLAFLVLCIVWALLDRAHHRRRVRKLAQRLREYEQMHPPANILPWTGWKH